MRLSYPPDTPVVPLHCAYADAFPDHAEAEQAAESQLARSATLSYLAPLGFAAGLIWLATDRLRAGDLFVAAIAIVSFLAAGMLVAAMRVGTWQLPKHMQGMSSLLPRRHQWLADFARGARDVVRCEFGERACRSELITLPPGEFGGPFAALALSQSAFRRWLANPGWLVRASFTLCCLLETDQHGRLGELQTPHQTDADVSNLVSATALDAAGDDTAQAPAASIKPYVIFLAQDEPNFRAALDEAFPPQDMINGGPKIRVVLQHLYRAYRDLGPALRPALVRNEIATELTKTFGSVGLKHGGTDPSWIYKTIKGDYPPIWNKLLSARPKSPVAQNYVA